MTHENEMARDPLLTTILDIDAALPGRELIIGGGYGLFLKQTQLANDGVRTLFAATQLPVARTTEDIDWILRAEVVTESEAMGEIRRCLDSLGFTVVETASLRSGPLPLVAIETRSFWSPLPH